MKSQTKILIIGIIFILIITIIINYFSKIREGYETQLEEDVANRELALGGTAGALGATAGTAMAMAAVESGPGAAIAGVTVAVVVAVAVEIAGNAIIGIVAVDQAIRDSNNARRDGGRCPPGSAMSRTAGAACLACSSFVTSSTCNDRNFRSNSQGNCSWRSGKCRAVPP